MTELVPLKPGLTPWRHDAEQLIQRWQEGRSPHTVRAYCRDLAHFARWSAAAAPVEAITRLLTGSMGEANECLHAYRGAMLDAGLAPATVNRRLSALRSIVQLGRTFGWVAWSLEIDGVKTRATGIRRALDWKGSLPSSARPPSIARQQRQRAMWPSFAYYLTWHCGAEVAMLDLNDVDVRASRLWIKGKGRREREAITLPPRTVAALKAWIKHRGREPGPLFINFHHANKSLGRLHANGIYWVVRSLGAEVEVTARPHGFRHSSITTGLDKVKDPRKVQKHGRHASMDTTMIYDDALSDFAGEVAKVVSEALEE
jgi:integrase/recombinase XerC